MDLTCSMSNHDDQGIDARLVQREAILQNAQTITPLEMKPVGASQPHGKIPNTPGAVAFISFLLGGIFFVSMTLFAFGGLTQSWWWATPQLAFFLAAWSGFHWGEFEVTAGWNREKCSVDCESPLTYLLPEQNVKALV